MIVHTDSKSLLLRVRPDKYELLRQILPAHSKEIDFQNHNLAVPHNLKVTKILRNIGIKAPSPIRYYYDWPRPNDWADPFEHQYATADFLTMQNRCFLLNEMGLGKTASVLWAADYLMKIGQVRRAVIVAPLSTLQQVWENEIFQVCMHRSCVVLHGSAEKRRELLSRKVDFYIINHDGLKIVGDEIRARKDIDLVIVDEAADYRNGETSRYEKLKSTIKEKKLWLMSGAPCPNAPTDAWALARLVDASRVDPFFTQFKRKTMNQISTYKWVPKPGSHQTAYDAMQPAIRFKKADCLDLPHVVYTNRSTGLSAEQQASYSQMKADLVAQAAGQQITAANAADKISKLRQILCGAIKDALGNYVLLDHGPRLKVLLEAIEQANAKVLIIVPFKGIVHPLKREIDEWHTKKGDGMRCEIVNGDVSMTDRNRIFQDFRDDPSLNELVCHPKVMSHGLNLTQADMVIFYAPIYSTDMSGQVENRINRPGAEKHTHLTILRIVANALEAGIYAMIEGRTVNQANILDLYKNELGL